jgi:hypothetical protein
MEGVLSSRDPKHSNLEKNLASHPQIYLLETMARQKRPDLQQHTIFPHNGGYERKNLLLEIVANHFAMKEIILLPEENNWIGTFTF